MTTEGFCGDPRDAAGRLGFSRGGVSGWRDHPNRFCGNNLRFLSRRTPVLPRGISRDGHTDGGQWFIPFCLYKGDKSLDFSNRIEQYET
ncbi:MAG: hypothetical protein JXB62_05540 [Pirellulales bacterium]|nr:hypothetical protein [Pirellulales bacterium]